MAPGRVPNNGEAQGGYGGNPPAPPGLSRFPKNLGRTLAPHHLTYLLGNDMLGSSLANHAVPK
jgi:hypothetical protein